MRKLVIFHRWLLRLMACLAGGSLVFMMALTCYNILVRQIAQPFNGTVEIVGYLGALVAALALGETQQGKEHLAVDILVKHYPAFVKRWVQRLALLLYLSFVVLSSVTITRLAIQHCRTGEVSETLRIVFYPFIFLVAAGFAVLGLTLLCDLILSFYSDQREVQA